MAGDSSFPDDGVTLMDVLCLGWDVGGWHGKKDGVGALRLAPDGSVEPLGSTARLSFGSTIAEGAFTLEALAEPIGLSRGLREARRIVVGVDAPFGFPSGFREVADTSLQETPDLDEPLPKFFIDNALAYRETDRAVFRETGRRPLSPSMGLLTNNTTKARAALGQLLRRHGDLRVPPFQPDEERCAVVEVYPALWEEVAETVPDGHPLQALLTACESAPTDDERDGLLSALASAAYECERTGTAGPLPSVLMPPPGDSTVREEGWIYAPVAPAG